MLQPSISPPPPTRDEPSVDLRYLGRRLGVDRRSNTWLVGYVTKLIEHYGFPPPLPTMLGDAMVDRVLGRSRWVRAHVDAWFDDRLPPKLALVIDNAAAARAAAELDGNAVLIAGAGA